MSPSFRKARKTAGYLLIELVVIFAGVYGAFFLNSYNESKKERENRLIYFKIFYDELEYAEIQLRKLDEELQAAISTSETSDSVEVQINRRLRLDNNLLVLKSAFENEKFASAIGSDFMVNISRGTNLIILLQKHLNILNEETRSFVLRNGNFTDYTQRFRKWHLEEMKYIRQLVQQLRKAVTEGAKPATQEIIFELQNS